MSRSPEKGCSKTDRTISYWLVSNVSKWGKRASKGTGWGGMNVHQMKVGQIRVKSTKCLIVAVPGRKRTLFHFLILENKKD